MPNKRQKFKDLVCLKLGKTEDSMSSCKKHGDPVLYDCCRKNVKQASFHKLEDGSAVFVIDTANMDRYQVVAILPSSTYPVLQGD